MSITSVIKEHRWFCYPLFLSWVILAPIVFLLPKNEVHIFLNGIHHPIADFFFKNWTHLGDGLGFVTFIALMWLLHYRSAIIASITGLIALGLILFLKQVVFTEFYRPTKAIVQELYLIPGVEMHGLNSFPSGHTTSAFAIFTLATLFSANKRLGLLYFAIAALVGYSRVYLSQHFLIDIYVGSALGLILAIAMHSILKPRLKAKWMQGGLLRRRS